MITPRPYQEIFISNTRNELIQNRSVLGVLPTGGGKTVCFTYITQCAMVKNSTVWIVAHRKELINQASKTLNSFGVKHGIISPKFTPNYHENVQVASVQTLANRMHKYTSPDIIIIDEAHHSTAGQWRKIIDKYPNAKIIGVTATPERSDGIGLGDIYDSIVIGPQIYELIELGYLVQPIVYRPPMVADLNDVKRHKSDYVRDDLARAMNKPTITGDAIEHYKKHAYGLPTIIFTANVQHAKDVAKQFRDYGFAFYAIDGSMDDKERDRLINGLGGPDVMGLVSCDLISEGTDIPAVGCLILLRPTQSLGLFLQQIGRGLRTIEGKSNCIILDHVGNTLRHGMPTQHRDWSLEGRKKRGSKLPQETDINITTCTECYYTATKFSICPSCGFEVKIIPQSEIETVEGELQLAEEIKRQEKFQLKQEISSTKDVSLAKEREKLEEIAKKAGYKRGWVDHMMKARTEKELNRVL